MGSVFGTFFLRVDDFLDGGTTQISVSYVMTHNAGVLQAWSRATEAELGVVGTSGLDCSIGSVIRDVGVLFGIEGGV
jgi:hypothetical protein